MQIICLFDSKNAKISIKLLAKDIILGRTEKVIINSASLNNPASLI